MSDCNTITKVLLRGGTDQNQRIREDLDPDSLKLHGFGVSEWMKFAYEFATHVNYFDLESFKTPTGDWQDFFKNDEDLEELLAELDENQELTPHLTLFICFLRLLELTSDRFNKLTRRHLDFYYTEVLQISKLPAEVDKVHIIFELSKSITQEKLGTDTKLNGGRDGNGKTLEYALTDEFVANRAAIKELKGLYFAHNGVNADMSEDVRQYVKAAPVMNSSDGLGDTLSEDNPVWYPFGFHHEEKEIDTDVFSELPDARLGFSLSSPVLLLTEGKRHVQITLDFENDITSDISAQDLVDNVSVSFTGEKKWINGIELSLSYSTTTNPTRNLLEAEKNSISYVTNANGSEQVKLYFMLDQGIKASAVYDSEIHGGAYDTTEPVFKFIINTSTEKGLLIYESFSASLETVNIEVQVEEMNAIVVENDHGTQNAKKPLYPFTTVPVEGSSLTLYHQELANKKWKSAGAYIVWKNNPSNLATWYSAYKSIYKQSISSDLIKGFLLEAEVAMIEAQFDLVELQISNAFGEVTAMDQVLIDKSLGNAPAPGSGSSTANVVPLNAIVQNDAYFKSKVSLKSENAWEAAPGLSSVTMFKNTSSTSTKEKYCLFQTTNGVNDETPLEGLRLSLNQSFLHELYPQLYALSVAKSITNSSQEIPNQPYTPLSEEIRLFYKAYDTLSLKKPNTSDSLSTTKEFYDDNTLKLYHEHAFGQAEEHHYLRELYDASVKSCSLTPKIDRGGELYIGLENADNLQTVSLLIQVLEGSENPETSSFEEGEEIKWDILCHNYWHELDSTLLLQNGIDNFLKSGLVKFKIPKEACATNTILDDGLFWVRAKMEKPFDAVCKVLGIHAQACLAQFEDNGNELSHLEKGLESGTIAKLIQRSSKVKKVNQPYNTFDGKAEEDDDKYYVRVSERLRHKNRAVNLWDYEHMVLQEFSDIYKVKCLNHSSSKSYVAPGHVMLVVIPDTVNKNVFDINKPMVSTARRNEIKDYIAQFTSLHVQLLVENPDYEELTVEIEVRFYDQYDESLYTVQIKEDIAKFLTPWAYDSGEEVEFGVTLHKSVLVDYLEELYYVDFLDMVTMKLGSETIEKYEPSTPRSILVSSDEHKVTIADPICSQTTTNTEEACQ